jgi:AraC-like DNA-binding protein
LLPPKTLARDGRNHLPGAIVPFGWAHYDARMTKTRPEQIAGFRLPDTAIAQDCAASMKASLLAAFVERVRVEAACRRLEATTEDAASIARACGFPSADVMRRAFARRAHVSPQAYRRRFS